MTIETRIQPIDEDIALMVSELFSPAARSAAIADFARAALAEAEAQNNDALGYVPDHSTLVDGAPSQDLDRVRPDGVIVFGFDLLGDIFGWILEQLQAHAPVRSGRFRDSIQCYADGAAFDVEADDLPPAAQYAFLSNVAYARKIEAGASTMAPDGVFQVVATLAAQRYGNQARIKFAYLSPADGGVVDWAAAASQASQARRIRGSGKLLHTDWLTRAPAIIITVR